MVEDSLENLRTAKRLGMKTVWVDRASAGAAPTSTSSIRAPARSLPAHADASCTLALKPCAAAKAGRAQAPDPADPGARCWRHPTAERITTAALAARLDVSEAALYRHFASKAQMFEGLIEFIEQTLFGLVNKITAEEKSGLRAARGDPRRCCSASRRRTAA